MRIGNTEVASVPKKITEERLRVVRREEGQMLRRMLDAPEPEKIQRGGQKTR